MPGLALAVRGTQNVVPGQSLALHGKDAEKAKPSRMLTSTRLALHGKTMKTSWPTRFAENVHNFQGYPIGKTLQYLTDPEIISLAGGLPSPEVFQRSQMRQASAAALDANIDRIMQYSPIPGEATLVDAVLAFSNATRSGSATRTSSSPVAARPVSISPAASC